MTLTYDNEQQGDFTQRDLGFGSPVFTVGMVIQYEEMAIKSKYEIVLLDYFYCFSAQCLSWVAINSRRVSAHVHGRSSLNYSGYYAIIVGLSPYYRPNSRF